MHLRLVVPPGRSDRVRSRLVADDRVTNVISLPGAALSPPGDVVFCDVTREATSDVLDFLRGEGLFDDGAVTLTAVDAAPSRNARRTEQAAPGAPDDAIVWDEVTDRAWSDCRGSWAYYVFLTLATMIAAIAVITDSSILVVGAMVVGPEFAVVASLALALVLRQPGLGWRALRLLVLGFVMAIVITTVLALLARAAGWITLDDVIGPRPLTGFIWRPDRWSAVVAVLAGCAGVLSQTAGKGNALVGVFISVTTVPAAGDMALSLAFAAPDQLAGARAQLGINLVGMTVAGVVTLLVQRAVWRVAVRRRELTRSGRTTRAR